MDLGSARRKSPARILEPRPTLQQDQLEALFAFRSRSTKLAHSKQIPARRAHLGACRGRCEPTPVFRPETHSLLTRICLVDLALCASGKGADIGFRRSNSRFRLPFLIRLDDPRCRPCLLYSQLR